MRVVFDTNVLIAAALKGGFSEDILKIASSTDLVDLICSEDILDELRKKLIHRFKWEKIEVDFFVQTIRETCVIVDISEKIEKIIRDPEDNKILECAVSGKANLIVSSDQDLINLKSYRGIGIIHPKTLTWTFPEYFKKYQK